MSGEAQDAQGVFGMPWSSARLLLWCVMSMVANACILPSDGKPRRNVENYPPEIDFYSLDPRPEFDAFVPEAANGFCRITLRARVYDRDDTILRVRWVADNAKSIVYPIDDDTLNLPEGSNETTATVDTRSLEPLVGVPHTISLFVTDSRTDWDATYDELLKGPKTDGARLKIEGDGGTDDSRVSWAMWSINFEEGACSVR